MRTATKYRKPRWTPLLLVALLTVTCGGAASPSGTTPSDEGRIWQERDGRTEPALPRGFKPLPSISRLVRQLKPAVVNVYTTQVVKPKVEKRERRRRFHDPFFEKFFGGEGPFDLFERFFEFPQREFKRNSLGSGFIVSADGHILTNHHVVEDASEIEVKLADERTFDAEVIGSDKKTDIALLRVKPDDKLPHVFLGDSDALEVGDWVVAIGNPFGLGHTVTTGIISGKDRQIGHGPYDDFLQTDAAINPGNSGGPLFDTAGNVVGINTAIVPRGSGIGFAVPINLAKDLLPQLRTTGKVVRGWLGTGIQDLTGELAESFGVEEKSGVLVNQVYGDSPADRAGLESGDIIVAVNGKKMSEVRDLTAKIASLPPGSEAEIEVIRDGKRKTFTVELGERESGEALATGEGHGETSMGLTVARLTPTLAGKLGVDEDLKGVVVKEVDPDSPAAGIVRSGDIILEVNRKRVSDPAELRRALSDRDEDRGVLLRIRRGSARLFVVIGG
jgi:serine protease Do